MEMDGPFKGRLVWDGSQDLQDLSISIVNVTYNDSGVYECHVLREFEFDAFTPSAFVLKNITLKVKEEGGFPCATLSPPPENVMARDQISEFNLKLEFRF